MTRTRVMRTIGVAALVAALVLVAIWWRVTHRSGPTDAAPATSDATVASSQSSGITIKAPVVPSASASSPTAVRSSVATPTTATGGSSASGCPASPTPLVPTHVTISRVAVTAPVVSVDARSSNGTMAPPRNQPWEFAWIDTTARPGSSAGTVNLTAHTYHAGGALGNWLYATHPLRAGDVFRLTDDAGHVACYRYTHLTTFWAKDYTSSSTAFYDPTASPELRLMVCWNYDAATGQWGSRVVFHAVPVTG